MEHLMQLLNLSIFVFILVIPMTISQEFLNQTVDEYYYSSDEFIDLINQKGTTWKAGRNFPPTTTNDDFKKYVFSGPTPISKIRLPVVNHRAYVSIPGKFDARLRWSKCKSIRHIRSQGSCNACWAVASASTMSDRDCIQSKGRSHFRFSSEDILTCCSYCNVGNCKGGFAAYAFYYWVHVGVVSGGDYHSSNGCKAYEFKPCAHQMGGKRKPCINKQIKVPKCRRTCQRKYPISYKNDRKRGKSAYIVYSTTQNIQKEIMTRGPVTAEFMVYYDFYKYKRGVYQHVTGKQIGRHAVRIIGWGVERGVKYWLVANSWNPNWGNRGYFKIIRGKNHLGIEGSISAGMAR